ncbi:MAG: helix-hairpin-helix domain-containing protein [Saprospiraceae bacterium]|nr:helix-hairpin-helix domain-containing protein [Saprospiraceae bacterium]
MKKLLQTIYYYTRTERIGILVLCLLSLVVLYLPRLFPLIRPPQNYDFTDFQAQIAALQPTAEATPTQIERFPFDPNTIELEKWQQLGVSRKVAQTILNFRKKGGRFYKKQDLQKIYGLSPATYDSLANYIKIPTPSSPLAATFPIKDKSPTRFPFDPNTVSKEELLQLGLSKKVASTWVNFRNKGGVFQKLHDVKKIYGLSEKQYQALKPLITLPEPAGRDTGQANANIPIEAIPISYERPTIAIDINQAEATDWEQLRGIGPAYARRIMNFREKLGGFISIDQVAETYQLPESTFQAIRPFLRSSPIKQPIKINHADAKTLQSHPFLNWKEAKAIVNYRFQHGKFSQVDDLHALHALSKETILRIGPYLSFE